MQLAAYCRHAFSLGHAAMLVNETMPDCLVEQARKRLADQNRTLKGLRQGRGPQGPAGGPQGAAGGRCQDEFGVCLGGAWIFGPVACIAHGATAGSLSRLPFEVDGALAWHHARALLSAM